MASADVERATVSIVEAARILGCSRGLAYSLAREGKIPVLRLGIRRLVVPKAALLRLLAEAGQSQGAAAGR